MFCAKRRPTLPTSGRGFNRAAAETAIARAQAKLKGMAQRDCPNGAILFCSEEFAEHWLPPTPLKGTKYWCDAGFDTLELQKALDGLRTQAYGIIVVDGAEALLGEVQCSQASHSLKELKRVRPSRPIPSETRRGGQSALRYERLREQARFDFLQKVAETAAPVFSDAPGLIVAGKADMKRKLLEELPRPLRNRVLCIIDLPCSASDDNALRQAADRARSFMDADGHRELDEAVSHFLELARSDADLCCYGEAQTQIALKMGAVEQLLVDVTWESNAHSLAEWRAQAEAHGTPVVEVVPHSTGAVEFCKAFRVGGCLRWPVDLELLEESASSPKAASPEIDVATAPLSMDVTWPLPQMAMPDRLVRCEMAAVADDPRKAGVVECRRSGLYPEASPMEPELTPIAAMRDDRPTARTEVFTWLQGELVAALRDPSAAESLAAGVEVILGSEVATDDEEEQEQEGEALVQTLEMLREEGVPETLVAELAHRWAKIPKLTC